MSHIPLNETIRPLFRLAALLARDNGHATFGPPHLLCAVLRPEGGLQPFLAALGKDLRYLQEWAAVRVEGYLQEAGSSDEPLPDAALARTFEHAELARLYFGFGEVTPRCLLAALTKPGIAFSAEQLKSLPLRDTEVCQPSAAEHHPAAIDAAPFPGRKPGGTQAPTGPDPVLQYCIDLTALAAADRLSPIAGREGESRAMMEILGRRNKPNVLIVGEAGVGKTALVEGFARAAARGAVPDYLQGLHVLKLDTGSLAAGASYKGALEERIKQLISALKTGHPAILFIDDLHELLDARGPIGTGAGSLLKAGLAAGELTVIGATTPEAYRKIIEPDPAFNRCFEPLQLAEPDTDAAEQMVALLRPHYISHHRIGIGDEAIAECVRLSKRYIKDKRLPDSALDLLDRAMSSIRMLVQTGGETIAHARQELDRIMQEEPVAGPQKVHRLQWFLRTLSPRLGPVLLGTPPGGTDHSALATVEELYSYGAGLLQELELLAGTRKEVVEKADIAAMVAVRTGIPLGRLQAGEQEQLLGLEQLLQRRVVGQEAALRALSEAILESRSGLNKSTQPIGSFFLLGPTGTGKTELAKSVAELLFNDERAMIRFDMSEFKEAHAASLLYGAPPGYVGYEEGGLLVNKIRQQPYSVVLFDEIEKAHPSVFDLFLQIMDEGRIHDKLGREGDFSNALVLFTSNIGADFIMEQFRQGIPVAHAELMDRMGHHFRPEFLARLTEIIPFGPITEEMAVRIFDIQMAGLHQALDRQGITLHVREEAKRALAWQDFDTRYGARQIAGAIRQQIRRPLSRRIIGGQVGNGSRLELRLEGAQLTWIDLSP